MREISREERRNLDKERFKLELTEEEYQQYLKEIREWNRFTWSWPLIAWISKILWPLLLFVNLRIRERSPPVLSARRGGTMDISKKHFNALQREWNNSFPEAIVMKDPIYLNEVPVPFSEDTPLILTDDHIRKAAKAIQENRSLAILLDPRVYRERIAKVTRRDEDETTCKVVNQEKADIAREFHRSRIGE